MPPFPPWVVGLCIAIVVVLIAVGGLWASGLLRRLHPTLAAEPTPSNIPPGYLGFQRIGNHVSLAGVDFNQTLLPALVTSTGQLQTDPPLSAPSQEWVLTDVGFQPHPPTTLPAGITTGTGVYAVTQESVGAGSEQACRQRCTQSPLCQLFAHQPTTGRCQLSHYAWRNVLSHFAHNIMAPGSPFRTEPGSNVHVLLHQPVIVTALHDSACDCNTICSFQEIRPSSWGSTGAGQCVGTLNHQGHYLNSCTGFTTHPERLARYNTQSQNNQAIGLTATTDPQFWTGAPSTPLAARYAASPHQKFCVCSHDRSRQPWPALQRDALKFFNLACPFRIPDVTTLLVDLHTQPSS